MKWRTLLGFFLTASVGLAASTYYLDPAGNDGNSGTSPAAPWASFTNLNNRTFGPDDQILFKRGATWIESAVHQYVWPIVHGAGTSGHPLIIGAYGTGSRPLIQMSGDVTERCFTLVDASYVNLSSLEISHAGAGIVVYYDDNLVHYGVNITDIVAHDFDGLFIGLYPNVTSPTYKTDPVNPSTDLQTGHDRVGFSYCIGVTGRNDSDTATVQTTALDGFSVTNCDLSHAGVGVGLDWDNHKISGDPSKTIDVTAGKFKDVMLDGLYIHDNDHQVSGGALSFFACLNSTVRNCLFDKASLFTPYGVAYVGFYLNTNCTFDNVTFRNLPVPAQGTTDLTAMDWIDDVNCTVQNCTMENVAGYTIGFTGPTTYPISSGVTFVNVTMLNDDWHFGNGPANFNVFSPSDGVRAHDRPTGTIHDNSFVFAPGVTLVAGGGDSSGLDFHSNVTLGGSSSGVDLARTGLATASSTEGPGAQPSQAIDGNDSTYWASSYVDLTLPANQVYGVPANSQWFQVDLGSAQPLNEVVIKWVGQSYGVVYELQASTDGVTFEPMVDRSHQTAGGTADLVFSTRVARYVRVQLSGGHYDNPPSHVNFGIYSFSVYNSENFAQGMAATASSTTAAAYQQPSFANDGNPSTYWTSAPSAGTEWYKVDLGVSRAINTVETKWGTANFAKAYTIAVSNDDVSYSPVASRSGLTVSAPTADRFPLVAARYVKITMTSLADLATDTYGIFDFRVLGANDIAVDGVATASTTATTPGYETFRAVDGNSTTSWSSQNASGVQYYKVDLGSVFALNQVVTKWGPNYATNYTIAVSPDDSAYTTVLTKVGAAGGTISDRFAPSSGRYLKVTMTAGNHADPINYYITTLSGYNELARGAATSASSVNGSYPTSNAVDLSDTTRWSSQVQSGAQWFKIDLGSAKVVNRMQVLWQSAYAQDYSVATSIDDLTYATVANRSGLTAATTTDDRFAPVSARYLKVTMTKGAAPDPTSYSIFTASVYGPHP